MFIKFKNRIRFNMMIIVIITFLLISTIISCLQDTDTTNFQKNYTQLITAQGSNGKWGFINCEGDIAIPTQFNGAYDFDENGLAIVLIDDKVGYIDTNGKMVIPPQLDFENIVYSYSFVEGLKIIISDTKYGYIDVKGNVVISSQFNDARDFSEGLAAIKIKDKWGFIDKQGDIVISPQFDDVGDFCEGLARVLVNNKVGYIDPKGNIVIPLQFDWNYSVEFDWAGSVEWWGVRKACNFSEGLAMVLVGNKYGYINTVGEMVIPPQFTAVDHTSSFRRGLARINMENKFGFINRDGGFVIPPRYDFVSSFMIEDSAAIAEVGGKRGLINRKGDWIISPTFDWIIYTNGSNSIGVKVEEKWGFIDWKGNFVISPKFEGITAFNEEFSWVKIDKKWGLIDADENIIIRPQFDNVYTSNLHNTPDSPFQRCLEIVRVGKMIGYVNKTGKIVYWWLDDD